MAVMVTEFRPAQIERYPVHLAHVAGSRNERTGGVPVDEAADRQAEYDELRKEALGLLKRGVPNPRAGFANRLQKERELLALQRRFRKIRARDYFRAPGRREAAATIDKCLSFRQGISMKLATKTDVRPGG